MKQKQKNILHILTLRDAGRTYEEIGKLVGLTRFRVSAIVRKYKKTKGIKCAQTAK